MFGKDIQENIFLLCTHADAKTPKVLQAVKQAKIQYQKFFRFNHSALFEDNESGKKTTASEQSQTCSDLLSFIPFVSLLTSAPIPRRSRRRYLQIQPDVLEDGHGELWDVSVGNGQSGTQVSTVVRWCK